MRDQVQRQSGFALFADEVALEEAAARDEVVFGRARQQRNAPFDGDQAGVEATKSTSVTISRPVIANETTAAGPADLMTTPLPTNRPAPMAPPKAIIIMCLCFSEC